MFSSGITAISTSADAAVTLVTVEGGYNHLAIYNTSANAGFFSIDGGTTWGYIAPGGATNPSTTIWSGNSNKNVLIKRVPSGSDITCFGYCDWLNFKA